MIYLDNAATTRLSERALAAMTRCHREIFANPSALHRPGVAAAAALREARQCFAEVLGGEPASVVFTSGGTESDNLAIRGGALGSRRARRPGANVVCSAVEHPAVLEACRSLEREGLSTRLAPVDEYGVVDIEALLALVDEGTTLVSLMHANNEVGSVQPVAAVGAALRARHPEVLFHVDAVQGFLSADLRPADLGAHLMSLSAHKVHGPKGVGVLWVAPGTRLRPMLFGGGQQGARRPGTENTPGAVGFAEVVRELWGDRLSSRAELARLRDGLMDRAREEIDGTAIVGHPAQRLPHHASLCFKGCPSESLLHHLDAEGVIASSGSACHSGDKHLSHVLAAMGYRGDPGVIRFTLSRETTAAEIDATLAALRRAVPAVRRLARRV